MEVKTTPLEGLLIIEPRVYSDERGWFMETYNELEHAAAGITEHFVQDNLSRSSKHTLRGLHFQNTPYAQGKLVRVISGSVLDVAVDIRTKSPTYGQHFSILLTGENKLSFWIPAGFAHGFVSLEDNTLFSYKCTNYYNKNSEDTLLWNDPTLGIDWGVDNPLISEKDSQGKEFKSFKSLF